MSEMEFALFGRNLFGDPILPTASGPIAERFTIPPFSVLNARDGDWQDRKRAWLATGIQSEIGRGAAAYQIGSKEVWNTEIALRNGTSASAMRYAGGFDKSTTGSAGTSIFDPVLCELSYRWFCPPGGQVVDPFAGGSVRGIVAGLLGYRYYGIELRYEQVDANMEQAAMIAPLASIAWVRGDSRDLLQSSPDADFILTCPPYGDLEVYSDDPCDLSAMDYPKFCVAYREILTMAINRLKPDRFMCVVVGEYRDPKTGNYRGFVPLTQAICVAAGASYYNEAILVTSAGSLPIRITNQFDASRKMGKSHQNVLVFVKGDPRKATQAIVGHA